MAAGAWFTLAPLSVAVADEMTAATAQKIAVPSYFYPGPLWNKLRQGAPTVGLAIINPNSGPGDQIDALYAQEVRASQARGMVVLGYVATRYGKRSKAAVKADIDQYQRWYAVDGIFLDETPSSCEKKPHYQALFQYIKSKNVQATVVINPGGVTGECFTQVADIIVNFEGSHAHYQNWRPAGWEKHYSADRFWHLVYQTPRAQLDATIALSRQRHAGWVYITPDRLDNPWDTLPSNTYWQQQIQSVGP
jgi:Spherulation-specific family 4